MWPSEYMAIPYQVEVCQEESPHDGQKGVPSRRERQNERGSLQHPSDVLTKVLPLSFQLHSFIAAQPLGPPNLIDGRSKAAPNACTEYLAMNLLAPHITLRACAPRLYTQ